MSSTCPRACSRLASAAVFISIGVVQFLVGMILLKSKYVFLLAGPDFWTSSSNIAVGCLLGISASVWKQSRKYESKKHIIRRNLLLALLFSVLIINATTLGILLLGEGNTLLSIRLESGGETTFGSEVLAYAYVTSICCPVICIVVSIVAMSGSCFSTARKNSISRKLSLSIPTKNRSRSLQWIYTQERPDLSKKCREPVMTTSAESSSDDSDIPLTPKHVNSVDDLQNVLSRMAQGKRDSILRDSTIMLQQLDLRRKNKYNSLNLDESYMGPALLRVKESAAKERHIKPSFSGYRDNSKTGSPKRYYSEMDGNTRFPPGTPSTKRICHSRDKQRDTHHKYDYSEFLEYQNDPPSFVENSSLQQYRKVMGKSHSRSKVADNALSYSSDATDYNSKEDTSAINKKSRKMFQTEIQDFGEKCVLTKPSHGKKRDEFFRDHVEVTNEKQIKQFNQASKHEDASKVLEDCFSPDGSDFSPDTACELSGKNSSWAGEVVPITVKSPYLPRFSHKLIPVASPIVPIQRDNRKMSDDSGISSIQSNSFSSEISNQIEFKDKENLSSFRENPKIGNKENMLEYPKSGSQSIKKYDLSKVITMAPISEEPNTELNSLEQKAHCSSFYETTPKKWKCYIRQQSLPSVFLGSSKKSQGGEESSGVNDTPRRKRSASGKALRKLWSLAAAENHNDFLDQVVDDDSLIGLSEEELIARQLRNRSIRKAVEQRLKEKMVIMMEKNCSEV